MLKKGILLVSALLHCSPPAFASSSFFESSAREALSLIDGRGQDFGARLLTSESENDSLPTSVSEARELFTSICLTGAKGNTVRRQFLDQGWERFVFTCSNTGASGHKQTTTFVFTSASRGTHLVDLQVLSIDSFASRKVARENGHEDKNEGRKKLDGREAAEIVLAVGLSSLASGAFARRAYPGESDKLKHVVIGNLIATSGALAAYYGFDLDKNKSALVGLGLAVLAGVLKEAYDSKHPHKHTADSKDAIATAAGGALGAFAIRLTFEF
jgi:hypothetical protein